MSLSEVQPLVHMRNTASLIVAKPFASVSVIVQSLTSLLQDTLRDSPFEVAFVLAVLPTSRLTAAAGLWQRYDLSRASADETSRASFR